MGIATHTIDIGIAAGVESMTKNYGVGLRFPPKAQPVINLIPISMSPMSD